MKIPAIFLSVCLALSIGLSTGCSKASFTTNKIGDVNVAVSINPDPPRVGHNTLKIKLTDRSGKPINDAQIKVETVMAAMPSMGMPEMRAQSQASLSGDIYEAMAHLGMDGNWTVNVDIKSKAITAKIEYGATTGAKGITLKGSSSGGQNMNMENNQSSVRIDTEKQQLIGVKTGIAKKILMSKEINAAGRIAHDPDLYSAQTEYLAALSSGSDELISSSRTRLNILGMSSAEIERLKRSGKPQEDLLVPGKKSWLYASVYEYDLPYIRIGQKVTISLPSDPGKTFSGTIASISPMLDPETRTAKVRAEIGNLPADMLHQMFVNAVIKANLGLRLAVPRDAVLDSGSRQIIFVDKGNGYFEPRQVKTGLRTDSYVEILSGISEGEKIVTSGNFLIDSESRLKSVVPQEHKH